jgi:MAF protein
MTSKLILASNSPRRRQLLALTGWAFTVRPVDIDERPLPGEHPADYVHRLAESKARTAAEQALPGEVILAADTTVADGRTILGKPSDAAEARQMLSSLAGRDHSVFTAIGISDAKSQHTLVDVCQTRVWMRGYSAEEIEAYIASGDPFDKAGAYAIQHPGFQPVERIEGCYACVVGLPLCRVVRAMTAFDLPPAEGVTAACTASLETHAPCPVYESILRISPDGGKT